MGFLPLFRRTWAAAWIAEKIRVYPVQRQRLPLSPRLMSATLGSGFSSSKAFAATIIPGVQ